MQQQSIMTEPPQVITTKDMMYIKDQMSWLLVAVKKCSHFAEECQDETIRQAIDRVGKRHERHYALLLKHCQNSNTAAMGQVPQQSNQQSQQRMQ